eukprot:gene11058-biopygen4697
MPTPVPGTLVTIPRTVNAPLCRYRSSPTTRDTMLVRATTPPDLVSSPSGSPLPRPPPVAASVAAAAVATASAAGTTSGPSQL